jgi:hypothetical protein
MICAHHQLNYIKTPRFPPPPICPLRPVSPSIPALAPIPASRPSCYLHAGARSALMPVRLLLARVSHPWRARLTRSGKAGDRDGNGHLNVLYNEAKGEWAACITNWAM